MPPEACVARCVVSRFVSHCSSDWRFYTEHRATQSLSCTANVTTYT